MSDTHTFDRKQQHAQELRSIESLVEELRIARLAIADHKLRETTLTDEIKRIDRNAAERIRLIKEEAVGKAAEIVDKVLAEDFAKICQQFGIEPQGSPEMQPSFRIAATLKWALKKAAG